jgi:hypothetical protein
MIDFGLGKFAARERGSVRRPYSPNKLLSYVSQYITLLPGDVIFTGTPGNTQAVTHGDTIEIELADCAIPWPFESTEMSGEFA